MKLLIVAFHPRTMTPYSRLYEEAIIESGNEYDIVFWDRFRNGALEKIGNEYIFHRICTLGGNKWKKIPAFFAFRKMVTKIINGGGYERIVILNTMPGILLSDILIGKYKNRFILDIRDQTYERYGFYRKRVNRIIDNSYISVISSRGFYQFLQRPVTSKIFPVHNISNEAQQFEKILDFSEKEKINIGFVGAARFEKENERLVKDFQNNPNFLISYYGICNMGFCLEQFCKKEKIENVYFSGAFQNEEKPKIYADIDVINSLCGNQKPEVKYLLPNRLYDAALFKRPMIVSAGTYLSDVVQKYGLGVSVENGENIRECFEKYIENFEPDIFARNCHIFLEDVEKDQQRLREKLAMFLKGNKDLKEKNERASKKEVI